MQRERTAQKRTCIGSWNLGLVLVLVLGLGFGLGLGLGFGFGFGLGLWLGVSVGLLFRDTDGRVLKRTCVGSFRFYVVLFCLVASPPWGSLCGNGPNPAASSRFVKCRVVRVNILIEDSS